MGDTRAFGGVVAVLGGGGARGMAHVGVLEILEREGLHPDGVVGTSIGAIVGGLYALTGSVQETFARLRTLFHSETFRSVIRKADRLSRKSPPRSGLAVAAPLESARRFLMILPTLTRKGVMEDPAVEASLEMLFRHATFRDTKIPFAAVALDLRTGRDVVFRSGPLARAVLASMSIPGIFPPVEIDRFLLVDGGITAKVPVRIARSLGADRVLAVDVSYHPPVQETFSSAFEILNRVRDLASERLVLEDLSQADLLLQPELGDVAWHEFDLWQYLYFKGRMEAEEHLDDLRKLFKPGPLDRLRPRRGVGKLERIAFTLVT